MKKNTNKKAKVDPKKKKNIEWGKSLDRRIEELKKVASKNKNFHIFVAVTKKNEKGVEVEGLFVSKDAHLPAVVSTYLDNLPEGFLEMYLLRRSLR